MKLIISYDLKDSKVRGRFARMLLRWGAKRIQMSVFEFEHCEQRVRSLLYEIERMYDDEFSSGESVLVIDIEHGRVVKYGDSQGRNDDEIFV